MEENLIRLYNTMLTIETKGESTKTMGDCLKFIEQLVKQEREIKSLAAKEPVESTEPTDK